MYFLKLAYLKNGKHVKNVTVNLCPFLIHTDKLGWKHWQIHVVALTSSDDNKNKA